jgi:hypothetical protein
MAVVVKVKLPNSTLRLPDGSYWEPPEEVVKFLSWVFSLDEQEYQRVMMFFAPIKFLTLACETAQNPLLSSIYNHMVMENYYAYRASYVPPPGSTRQ